MVATTLVRTSIKQVVWLVALDIVEVIYCLNCFFDYPCVGDVCYCYVVEVITGKILLYCYNYCLLSKHSCKILSVLL